MVVHFGAMLPKCIGTSGFVAALTRASILLQYITVIVGNQAPLGLAQQSWLACDKSGSLTSSPKGRHCQVADTAKSRSFKGLHHKQSKFKGEGDPKMRGLWEMMQHQR